MAFNPYDPTASAAGRHAAAGLGINTLTTGAPTASQQTALNAAANTVSADQWDRYIAVVTKAMAASSGFQRMQFEAQIKDAEKARQNAMKIAQLQAETSRYGVDVGRENLLAQLTENARQFDQNHVLDMQKFGLSQQQFEQGKYEFGANLGQRQHEFGVTAGQNQQNINLGFAKTATDYLSTPDRYFQAGDYIDMGKRALQGLGPQPYGATGTPRPKTTDEFAVLSGYTQPGERAYAGGTPSYGEAPGAYAGQGATGRGSDMPSNATNEPIPDPRLKAVRGVFEALPPSGEAGLDGNDWAALQAAKAIYSSNLKPGTLQRMRPGQLAMNRSAGTRFGISVPDWEQDVASYGVGQQSVRAA